MVVAALFLLAVQAQQASNVSRPSVAAPPTRAMAVRAATAPEIDGRDTDEVWQSATPITDFVEFDPVEGKEPRFKTEARVAYDARNFYVFVRMFDPEPDKILTLLARRDVRPATDQIKIIIDSYHDRRSGYEFAVSPSGVKRDYAIYNDWNEDGAWDGVWDVKTTIDSLGWTAEFRIPLSQLRFSQAESHTFGFAVWRDIERYKERVSWPLYKRTTAGLASQLGEIGGITGLSSPRRLELSPYLVTKNSTRPDGDGYSHPQDFTGGLDFKYGITSNVTVDGTINPDFGQVEADPAVLNLSAFETFFGERRPFFIEGAGLLTFPVNCFAVNDCGSESLFYSRRIGRSPQLSGVSGYGDASSPTATTILGAAKVTSRMPGGLSLGILDAVTGSEEGVEGRTLEPRTNYAVVRASQDLRKGQTGIGVIGTFVHRSNDRWTEDFLRSSAIVGGVDLRHRFLGGRFEVTGKLVGSRVTGTPEAMDATQRSSVHYFQRPDASFDYDPTRTSLGGDYEQVTFGKVGGGMLRFETSYQRVSAGFEANDLGFLRRADWQSQASWAQLAWNKPALFFRRFFWNGNEWMDWTASGLALQRAVNSNIHTELKNAWWFHFGGTLGGLGEVYCDRCSRGGPALRTDESLSLWSGIEGDSRGIVTPRLWLSYWESDGGRTRGNDFSPGVSIRIGSRFTSSFGLSFSRNRDDRQWFSNIRDSAGVTHHTFAHLEQRTTSLRTRMNFTATPTLTLQLYAEPFVSKGDYSDLRELDQPRSAEYDQRFKPFTLNPALAADPGGFNFKQFRSNVVLRWEYRPGSALFLVWQQGRTDSEGERGTRSLRDDLDRLFSAHADNTFLVKVSYWLDR